MALEGIDVSAHQGDIDWQRVRNAGIEFAFVKATEGVDFTDSRFTKGRVAALERVGIDFGPYTFAWPSDDGRLLRDAREECDYFWKIARRRGALRPGQLAGVLDIEAAREGVSPAEARRWIRRWYRRYKRKAKANGFRRGRSRRPIVYTGHFWRDFLGNPIILSRCLLWLAAYVSDPKPYTPRAWKRITFWQYTDRGRVAGVDGPVDRNRFFGSRKRLRSVRIKEAA